MMLKRIPYVCILIFTLHYQQGESQNLVPNPSFEDTIPCSQIDPYNPRRLGNLANWWGFPYPIFYSLLQYDTNSLCWHYTGLLPGGYYTFGNDSIFWYQYPRTGNNLIGLSISLNIGQTWSDILCVRLINPLQQNHKYCVEFYLNLYNFSSFTISTIGAYFTSDSLLLPSYDTTFNSYNDYITYFKSLYGSQPQIINTPGNYITDTVGWQLVSGEFIAQGNENFIAIGAIFNTWEMDTFFLQPPIPITMNAIYINIDDVSVTDCTVGIEETMQQEEVLLSPSLAQEYVTIEYKPLAGNSCRLEVFSSMGSRVMEQTLPKSSNKHKLTVSQLPPGVYYLRLQWAKQTAVGRFVKQ